MIRLCKHCKCSTLNLTKENHIWKGRAWEELGVSAGRVTNHMKLETGILSASSGRQTESLWKCQWHGIGCMIHIQCKHFPVSFVSAYQHLATYKLKLVFFISYLYFYYIMMWIVNLTNTFCNSYLDKSGFCNCPCLSFIFSFIPKSECIQQVALK